MPEDERDEAGAPMAAERFDPFGFPLDQAYLPTSRCAPLCPHMQRWARYWAQKTSGGALPEALPRDATLRALVERCVAREARPVPPRPARAAMRRRAARRLPPPRRFLRATRTLEHPNVQR